MSSLQIADITGKNHADVMRDIRKVLDEAEIGESEFAGTYIDVQNKDRPCFLLPRFECDLVVSGYSVKYRAAIIKRWHELENKPAAPNLADPAALRDLLLGYAERVIGLETTVSILTPKSDALDRIADAEGLMNITNAAKVLQVQPKALFTYLDCNSWTYRRPGGDERVPYQTRIEQGLMTMKAHRITNQKTGEEMIKERALITPKGLAKLSTIFSQL
jgi:phage antirepressor YoqD-like protein